MKKRILNNKGYMLVEVIVASVIALVVAYFLIDITIKMVNKNNDYYLQTVMLADKNLITKEIMDDFNNSELELKKIEEINENSIKFTFSDDSSKTLSINKTEKIISYGNYSKKLNENFDLNSFNFYTKHGDNILNIETPIYSNYSNLNFGINFAIKYNLSKTEINIPTLVVTPSDLAGEPKDFEYNEPTDDTEPSCYDVILTSGSYKLETWGAQGGDGLDMASEVVVAAGGKGGYSTGNITVSEETVIYVCVGGKGGTPIADINGDSPDAFSLGGFNGGGASGYSYGGAGGGASDIRILNNDLYYRVIVAGGGGGSFGSISGNSSDDGLYGGQGGGLFGITGDGFDGDEDLAGKGGSLSRGGTRGKGSGTNGSGSTGLFGQGGAGSDDNPYDISNHSAGGGGGWYGGGGSGYDPENSYYGYKFGGGAGGGSGWIFTEEYYNCWVNGCTLDGETIEKESITDRTTNYMIDITTKEMYYLTDAATVAGSQCFPTIDSNKTASSCHVTVGECPSECERGHEGNGYIKITPLSDGATVIVLNATPEEPVVESTIKLLEYTGDVQNCTLSAGKYKLEVWGAQGGDAYNDTSYPGGKGGYSYGQLELNGEKNIFVFVGGKGANGKSSSNKAGGYNGGGASYGSSTYSAAGGGASDIRIDGDTLYNRLIVAGGGGGAGYNTSNNKRNGGAGGGLSGIAGKGYDNSTNAKGGTISNGGDAGYYSNTRCTSGSDGSFGYGGNASTASNSYSGGGGGGWYGGGGGSGCNNTTFYKASSTSGGGGGSGWVYTAENYATWMSGNSTDASNYELGTEYYLTGEAKTIAGDDANGFPTTSDDGTWTNLEYGHEGNGAVKITTLTSTSVITCGE